MRADAHLRLKLYIVVVDGPPRTVVRPLRAALILAALRALVGLAVEVRYFFAVAEGVGAGAHAPVAVEAVGPGGGGGRR